MSLIQCRLKPVLVDDDTWKKHYIKARYNSLELAYQKYKGIPSKASIARIDSVTEIKPYTVEELTTTYGATNFSRDAKLVLEVGCGIGDFLVHSAIHHPDKTFIGVDAALPCIQRAVRKVGEAGLTNLLFYCGLIDDFLFRDFSEIIFDEIMVNFPDPWPKKRHLKRRIVNLPFIEQSHKRLKQGGLFYTATDVYSLHEYHKECLSEFPKFTSLGLDLSLTERGSQVTPPNDYYEYSSKYQLKNLAGTTNVYYTTHQKKTS